MKKIYFFKKYKSLLLQAALIFLAVFLSFLADDYRDYLNRRANQREFLKGIYENLRADSTTIKRNIRVNEYIFKSGMKLLETIESKNIKADSLEFYFQGILIGETYKSNKSNYDALKYSGLVQEIENNVLRQKLTEYYENDIDWMNYFSELFHKRYFKFVDNIKPFLLIKPYVLKKTDSKRNFIFETKLIDSNYMLNDPVWKSSLGETVGLLQVRIYNLKNQSHEIDELRQMILQELD